MRREERDNKEENRERGRKRAMTPTPLPGFLFFFAAHISLRCPHDLNAWNRLGNLGSDRLIEVRLIQDWL